MDASGGGTGPGTHGYQFWVPWLAGFVGDTMTLGTSSWVPWLVGFVGDTMTLGISSWVPGDGELPYGCESWLMGTRCLLESDAFWRQLNGFVLWI